MNRRLSKKQKWFKEIVLTEEDELYVALDVHKTTQALGFAAGRNRTGYWDRL